MRPHSSGPIQVFRPVHGEGEAEWGGGWASALSLSSRFLETWAQWGHDTKNPILGVKHFSCSSHSQKVFEILALLLFCRKMNYHVLI